LDAVYGSALQTSQPAYRRIAPQLEANRVGNIQAGNEHKKSEDASHEQHHEGDQALALEGLNVPGMVQRAYIDARRMTPADMLYVQRTIGNQAALRLLHDSRKALPPAPRVESAPRPIQRKLKVGPAGDRYEREADSVAKAIMQRPARGPLSQRQ